MSTVAMSQNGDDIFGLGTWLPGHHNEPIDGIHVFAIAEGRVFGDIDLGKQYPFDVKIVILGVTLGLKGYIDTDSLEIDAELYIKIPFIPEIPLARVKGSLKNGVLVSFNVVGVIVGTARFYLKNKWEVWMYLDATILGKSIAKDIYLFTIPH